MSEKATTKRATHRAPRAAPRAVPARDKTAKGDTALPAEAAAAIPAATQDAPLSLDEERQRQAVRENARRIIRESGIGELLRTLNRNALQERGWFEEYDSGVIMKWGTGYTRRHIWVDIAGDQLRFRLLPHITCAAPVPACDGEYHSFTRETWRLPGALLHELHRNYEHPVAETSED